MTQQRSTTGRASTRLCVCAGENGEDALAREFRSAGWVLRSGSDVPVEPWTPPQLTACVAEVGVSDIAGVAELLTRSVSVIARTSDHGAAVELFDQCRRLAIAEWYDDDHRPSTSGLEQVHVDLLLSVRAGGDVQEAARAANLSSRTAARRLAEARTALGARTTGEAVARLGARIDELRG